VCRCSKRSRTLKDVSKDKGKKSVEKVEKGRKDGIQRPHTPQRHQIWERAKRKGEKRAQKGKRKK